MKNFNEGFFFALRVTARTKFEWFKFMECGKIIWEGVSSKAEVDIYVSYVRSQCCIEGKHGA